MKSITLQTNDTAIIADDQLGQIQFAASSESDGGAAINVSAKIETLAEAAFGSASHATAIVFSTATSDANAPSERVRFSNDGKVGLGTASPSYKLHVNGDIGLTNQGFYASPTGVMVGASGLINSDGQTTFAHGSFSSQGDAQCSSFVLRCTTTDATFTTAQNNGADIVVPNDISIMFIATITGRRTDQVNAANSDNASYKLIGLLHNDAHGIALLGSVSKTVIAETDSNWDVQATVTGSGSSGSDKLNIQCKGAASKTVNWVVKLDTVEVISSGGGGSDEYANTILLYPFDSDANDDSSTGNNLTLTNASIDTSVKKYGSGSLKFTNFLSNHKAQGSMPSLGTGNFTVEFWLRLAGATSGNKYIVDRGAGTNFGYANPGWTFLHNGTGSFIWNVKDDYDDEEEEYTTSLNISSTTTASSSVGSFIHVALVRQGTTYRIYIDGTQEASATGTATNFGVHNFALGDAMVNGNGIAQNSYIDDFRVSNTAVYPDGTTFTVPSAAHPTS